jgi:hypothetical protein
MTLLGMHDLSTFVIASGLPNFTTSPSFQQQTPAYHQQGYRWQWPICQYWSQMCPKCSTDELSCSRQHTSFSSQTSRLFCSSGSAVRAHVEVPHLSGPADGKASPSASIPFDNTASARSRACVRRNTITHSARAQYDPACVWRTAQLRSVYLERPISVYIRTGGDNVVDSHALGCVSEGVRAAGPQWLRHRFRRRVASVPKGLISATGPVRACPCTARWHSRL